MDPDYRNFNSGTTAPLKGTDEVVLFCPICSDGCSPGGDHHICCLPCGHMYGLSCIKKWLERSSKCPYCLTKSRVKDIRLLYTTQVVAIDGALQKKVKSLEAKCEKQGFELFKKEAEWKKKEDDFCKRNSQLKFTFMLSNLIVMCVLIFT
ncbi:hypothetical protein CASFOL_027515 [Castilleja foliolosa]|uniref:RING-type domain-containing protein n=1 Tax=Castilleja foliolosa TaxID=1961234 RepID=A0ABD3CG01_9LAMI